MLVLDRQDGTEGLVVPAGRLPARARHPDAVLAVALRDGDLVAARYLPRATARRTTRAQSRLDRLARDGGAEEAGADSPVGEPDGTGDDG